MHILYITLIDGMETADTAVPSSQFPRYLQKIKSEILEQYQVMFHKSFERFPNVRLNFLFI